MNRKKQADDREAAGRAQAHPHASKGCDATVTRILSAYNVISRSINPARLVRVNLTSSQIKVLFGFAGNESFSMGALSQLHGVSVSTMTSMVDRLIQNGLLKREKDETDRRVVRVCLSARGRKAVGQLMQARREALEAFLVKLDDGERGRFLASIEDVAYFLKKARTTTVNNR
ncbi:MAG: MarR family transcriptional regulator [Deltaproteobacteria bacterium]|nr:MarR family transcriptional regulator [Deltaproteobacteria bacterium]